MLTKKFRRSKLTHDDIKQELLKFGYKLLSNIYLGTKQPLKMRCKRGHLHTANWNTFARGNRCRKCFLEKQVQKGLKKIVLRDPFYNISEAARILRVSERDLRHHVRLGVIPGPKHMLGKVKKYYKIVDIKEIESLIK